MSDRFLALCYHYLRPPKSEDAFPSILGNSLADFKGHIDVALAGYTPLKLDELNEWVISKSAPALKKPGLVFTFDDALSEHYEAAQLLADKNIQGHFFLPTCVFADEVPPNPTIVHYGLAHFRIAGFLKAYREALEELGLDRAEFDISYVQGEDDPWKTIKKIKTSFRYHFHYSTLRDIHVHIYKNLFLKEMPDILERMHLTKSQVKDMIDMGHVMGVHTHTHVNVGSSEMSDEDFEKEVLFPKRYLEDEFGADVTSFSYPFGRQDDRFEPEEFFKKTKEYDLAFIVENVFNTTDTSPLAIARYSPMSTDTPEILADILKAIAKGEEAQVAEKKF